MVVDWGTEQYSIAYLHVISTISTITNILSVDIIKYNIIPTAEIRTFYLYYDNFIMFGFGIMVGKYY